MRRVTKSYADVATSEAELEKIRGDRAKPELVFQLDSLLIRLSKKLLKKPTPLMKLLDVGCGEALDLVAFARMGFSCVGVDLSRGMLAAARKHISRHQAHAGIELVNGDANRLPFADSSFDVVFSRELSLFNIPLSPFNAICEMRRVLSNGGVILCMLPTRDYPGSGFKPYSTEEIKHYYRRAGIQYLGSIYPLKGSPRLWRLMRRVPLIHSIIKSTPFRFKSFYEIGVGTVVKH